MAHEDALTRELRAAGWRPGRRIAPAVMDRWSEAIKADGFSVFGRGLDVLGEYGGLRVGKTGPGLQKGRMGVELDPLLVSGEADRFKEFERLIGEKLFPLGEVENGHALLALSDRGALYMLMDEIWLAGETFGEGLSAIVLGLEVKLLDGLSPWAG